MCLNKLGLKDWFFAIGIWFSAFAGLLDESVNKVALYIVLPFLFLLTFFSHKSLRSNRYMNLLSFLFIWILFSVLWASNLQYAMVQVNQILGSFLLCFIFSVKGQEEKNLPWIYFSFLVVLLGDWYYAYNHMFNVIEFGVDRLDDLKLNANTFGYHTFYATFAAFILGEWNIKGKRIMHIVFLLMIPLSFVTAIYTASRQILIIQIPLILLLLYGRYFKSGTLKVKLSFIILFFIGLILFVPKTLDVYNGSRLQERSELDVKDDIRGKLVQDAIKVGNENFPFGVGANNYMLHSFSHHFSHNTYLELYANEGVLGVFIYVYLIVLFLSIQWKRYRLSKDIMYFYFFVAGFIFFIDGFFYVFYPHLWLISFLILVATHSETYYLNKQTQCI